MNRRTQVSGETRFCVHICIPSQWWKLTPDLDSTSVWSHGLASPQVCKWVKFYKLTSHNLWPSFVTFDLINMWRFPHFVQYQSDKLFKWGHFSYFQPISFNLSQMTFDMWLLTSSTNDGVHVASTTQLWLKSFKACGC